jgi:hypothetical protein
MCANLIISLGCGTIAEISLVRQRGSMFGITNAIAARLVLWHR